MNLLKYLPKFLSRPKGVPRAGKPKPVKTAPKTVVIRDPIPLPTDLKWRLNGVRARYRSVGISTGLVMMLGAISLLLLVQAVSDWWFDLPWFARAGFLLADLAILVTIYRRHLDGPLRKGLTLRETALRVEKKWPQLQQSVIAAVELTEGRPYSTRGSRQLVDLVLQQARARTTKLKFSEVISARALSRWGLLSGLAVLAAGGLAAFAWPASVALLERIILLNVPLPTKTIVVPVTRDLIVPVGSDVDLTALAKGIIPTHGRVTVTYDQGPPQEFPVNALPDTPDTFTLSMHNVQTAFKYSFYLNDGHSAEFTVTAKPPPAVSNLACEQTFPGYTTLPSRKLAPTELSLLAGSQLKVEADCTDPLKSATVIMQGINKTVEATLSNGGTHLEATLSIPAKDLTGFSIHLVDQADVNSANETVYPIVLIPDNPPTVKIIEPADDQETITLRAKPVIAFDATDDYGITKLAIFYQLIPPMVAGETDNRPPADPQQIPITVKGPNEGHQYEYLLDVSKQVPAWQEGYTVNYWIEATDNNTVTGPGVTKTDHKQFGIISLEAKQAEILDRLKQNAAEIDSLSGTQQKINNDVQEAIPQK
jgi:hypothetical protein